MAWQFGRGWSSTHPGVDLVAGTGTPIHAIASGTVAYAGDSRRDAAAPSWTTFPGYGRGAAGITASIDSGGMVALYAHMSRLAVRPGQSVRAGELVGYVGATGNATGPHLHLGIVAGGRLVDPLSLYSASQLLASVAGSSVVAIEQPGGRSPDEAIARLREAGIPTDPGHRFTADEGARIAALYGVTGDVAASIARFWTGKTVQDFVTAWTSGTSSNVTVDPFTAIANAIAGIPGALGEALGSLLWLGAILAVVILGLYLTVSPGGSKA